MKHFNEDPHLELTTSEGIVTVRRDNSALYTFFGANAMYDHVFVQTKPPEESGSISGFYVFQFRDSFRAIANFVRANKFPQFLNGLEPAACDKEAYESSVINSIPDYETMPVDWEL